MFHVESSMSGVEIEHMLKIIDANVDLNRLALQKEVLQYIREHEVDVLTQLESNGEASIPTSKGSVTIPMDVLKLATA